MFGGMNYAMALIVICTMLVITCDRQGHVPTLGGSPAKLAATISSEISVLLGRVPFG